MYSFICFTFYVSWQPGKYLTPNRIDIDRNGIEPNFRSQPSAAQADKVRYHPNREETGRGD